MSLHRLLGLPGGQWMHKASQNQAGRGSPFILAVSLQILGHKRSVSNRELCRGGQGGPRWPQDLHLDTCMHVNAVHLLEPVFGMENNDGFLFRHNECQRGVLDD